MPKYNLPGVHGGVSQQSPNLRLTNQHSAADNVLFDLLAGIRGPRWGTTIGTLFGSRRIIGDIKTTDGKVWFISWNKTTGAIAVHDVINGVTETPAGATTYLTGADPEDLVVLPILDTAIVINKKKTVTQTYLGGGNGALSIGYVYVPQVFEDLSISIELSIKASKAGEYPVGGAIASGTLDYTILAADTPTTIRDTISRDLLNSSGSFAVNVGSNLGACVISTAGMKVTHGGNTYSCDATHISGASTEPGVGASWATVWTNLGATSATNVSIGAWSAAAVKYLDAAALAAVCPVITITNKSDFEVTCSSSKRAPDNDETTPTIKYVNTIDAYEKLPPYQYLSTIVHEIEEGHYVGWDSVSKSYIETACPGHDYSLTKATMPHELRWDAIAGWTFGSVAAYDTTSRLVGDTTSAPKPDFVGRMLNYGFYYRNRLCFLADNYVAMSTVGEYYNWFPSTATEVLDGDPIVVFPAHAKYSELLWAIPFSKQLVLLSNTKQYVLHSGYEALTPQTVAIDEATSYTLVPTIEPVLLPASMVLPLNHNPFLGVLEYKLDDQQIASEGSMLSTTVPQYIPHDITHMVYVPSEHMVLFYKRGSDDVWVYKFNKREDGSLTQMAWSHWTMPVDLEYAVVNEGSTIIFMGTDGRVVYMDTSDDWSTPVLDYRIEYTTVSHGDTIVALTGMIAVDQTSLKEYPLTFTGAAAATIDTYENADPVDIYVGYPIEWSVELSPLILRDDNGLPRADVAATIENIQLDWIGGQFDVTLMGQGLPTRTKTIVPLTTTDVSVAPGASHEEPTPTRVLMMAPAKRAVVSLRGTSYMSTQVNNISYNLDITRDWG